MSTNTTTVEQTNEQAVRRFLAAFGAVDETMMDELLAPGFVAHGMAPGLSADATGMKQLAALMHAGLQECRTDIDDVIAGGDKVAIRYSTHAIHRGHLFGAPPTGRAVTLSGIEIYRLVNGRVAEFWGEYDMSDLFGAA